MSIGPLGISAGTAGTPLAQAKGTEIDRVRQEVADRERTIRHEEKAEAAEGVGEPDCEDHEAAERDADGNRTWEEDLSEAETKSDSGKKPRSKDPSRERGNFLDLLG
jgi:hypothetical protein